MKQLHLLLIMMLCIAHQYTFSQTVSHEQKVVTFDKLQKTIISLPACSQPNVKIEPVLVGYKLETVNGKYALVFDKPVAAGLYAITFTSGATTEKIEWRVLPSELESKAQKYFANTKVYYGHPIGAEPTYRESWYVGQNMQLPTDELPSSQFFVRTTFDGVAQPFERFRERFIGRTKIPASVKIVKWEVVWEYPPTKEEIVLCSRETEPLQLPPDIEFTSYNSRIWRTDSPFLNNKGLDTAFQIAIRGIRVDAEVGFDANNTDPDGSKSIKATLNDVKAPDEVRLNYSWTKLQLYNGDDPNPNSKWVADSSTFYVVSGAFDKSDGRFPVTIQVKGLPRLDITELRGDIVLKVKASIWNGKADKSGVAETTLTIPISIPLNMRHIGLSDIAAKGKEKKGKSK
jgi:hypothetical protein